MTAQASNTGPLICRLIRMPNDPLGQINRNNPHPCLSSLWPRRLRQGESKCGRGQGTTWGQVENKDTGVDVCGERPVQTSAQNFSLSWFLPQCVAGKGCKNRTQDAFLLIVAMHSIQWDPVIVKHSCLPLGEGRDTMQAPVPLKRRWTWKRENAEDTSEKEGQRAKMRCSVLGKLGIERIWSACDQRGATMMDFHFKSQKKRQGDLSPCCLNMLKAPWSLHTSDCSCSHMGALLGILLSLQCAIRAGVLQVDRGLLLLPWLFLLLQTTPSSPRVRARFPFCVLFLWIKLSN